MTARPGGALEAVLRAEVDRLSAENRKLRVRFFCQSAAAGVTPNTLCDVIGFPTLQSDEAEAARQAALAREQQERSDSDCRRLHSTVQGSQIHSTARHNKPTPTNHPTNPPTHHRPTPELTALVQEERRKAASGVAIFKEKEATAKKLARDKASLESKLRSVSSNRNVSGGTFEGCFAISQLTCPSFTPPTWPSASWN